MIKRFKVIGLNGTGTYSFSFNNDINILTGRNGTGKTTLLKMLWYMTSPLRMNLLTDINFERAVIETDNYRLDITKSPSDILGQGTAHIACCVKGANCFEDDVHYGDDYPRRDSEKIWTVNQALFEQEDRTLFFPTFRRIEGGVENTSGNRYRRLPGRYALRGNALSEAIEDFSNAFSDEKHKLIASISTKDIVQFLTNEFNAVSEETNRSYVSFSREIRNILSRKRAGTGGEKALVKELREKLKQIEVRATDLMKPFNVLSKLISDIFVNKGIKVSSSLSFGLTSRALDSESLSAGEKQMLSFLSYNAFSHNAVMFIDEPELSLHVDWQRILFEKLLEQDTTNQFIVTTHSPFIYTRYPDKEFFLSPDRGCNEGGDFKL